MCIAILSEHGTGYPTKEIFQRCWDINDDGAGYAFLNVDNKWNVKKGFMTFDAFWDSWEAEKFKDENTVVIHFRWGTSGKMTGKKENGKPACDPGCTHPFPVTDDQIKLFQLEYVTDNIIMHNGVVGNGKNNLSDTMVAIIDYVAALVKYMDDKKIVKLLENLLDAEGYSYGSRWWIGKGANSYLLGDWIKDEETNIWYSKDEYLEPKKWEANNETHPYWNNYNPYEYSKVDARSPIVVFSADIEFKEFATKKNNWSWAAWKKWEKKTETEDTGVLKKAGETTEPKPLDGITEIYNSKNEVIALIDEDGNEVWAKEPQTVDESRHCMECGATVKKSKCDIDGRCPHCYTLLFPEVLKQEYEIECPYCHEKNHIIDSTFSSQGDSECCRCGCLFWEQMEGEESIVGWNEDTKFHHSEVMKQLIDGAKRI